MVACFGSIDGEGVARPALRPRQRGLHLHLQDLRLPAQPHQLGTLVAGRAMQDSLIPRSLSIWGIGFSRNPPIPPHGDLTPLGEQQASLVGFLPMRRSSPQPRCPGKWNRSDLKLLRLARARKARISSNPASIDYGRTVPMSACHSSFGLFRRGFEKLSYVANTLVPCQPTKR